MQPFNNTKNLKFQYLSDASDKIIIKKDYFREISLGIINNKSKVELMFNDFKLNLLSKLKRYFPKFYSFIVSSYLNYKTKNEKNNFKKTYSKKFIEKFDFNTASFIAHGGGKIDQFYKTNSLESLNISYSKGARLFELDLNLTADQKIVAVMIGKRENMTDLMEIFLPIILNL